jgi:hypothetical protein
MDWRHCWEHTNSLIFFWSIVKLTWLIFGILTRWVLKGEHFQAFSNARNESENRKLKKLWKKERKKEEERKDQNVHLILSHVNHTFLILNPPIGPQAFRHTRCTLRIKKILYLKKVKILQVQFKIQFASNWSLGFCLKLPLKSSSHCLCVCVCCARDRLRLFLSFLFLYEFVIV